MIDLSICIPTYNRVYYLDNCLNSIKFAKNNSDLKIEVCVSDNCSDENIEELIEKYKKDLNLNFNRNEKNLGMAKNILKAVSMAKGEFCWILGNDDILLNDAFKKFKFLSNENNDVDFFYINSFQFNADDLKNYSHPINPKHLNLKNLIKFSDYKISKKMDFFELFDPKKSYEFMLSIFLCVFRRKIWMQNLDAIDEKKISELAQYSNLHNTAPHSLIWARGYKNKLAYFFSNPLTINVHGPRSNDWGKLYPFVEGVRIPQILDNLRKEGMPFLKYIRCKNFALRRLIPSFFYMISNKKESNYKYVDIKKDLFYNIFFPMVYVSLINLIIQKIFFKLNSIFKTS